MKNTSGFQKRLLGLRGEKKPSDGPTKSLFSILRLDAAKNPDQEGDDHQIDTAQITLIKKRLVDLQLPVVLEEDIEYSLRSKYAAGDVDKAIELLQLQIKSVHTTEIIPYNPNIHMLGAENRHGISCYLDALLFAMFAKLDSFECMLKTEFTQDQPKSLAAILRLWVNMLRSGKLIEANMTMHLQEALADAGWIEARRIEQQDTSEAFAFITETLQLPLLNLQVDLFHHGQRDDADHKVVEERLLNIPIPTIPDDKELRLEDCLEEYFNAQVNILRDSLDEKKKVDMSNSTPPPLAETSKTADASPAEDEISGQNYLSRRHTMQLQPGLTNQPSPKAVRSPVRAHRSNTESIIQRVILDDEGRPTLSSATSEVNSSFMQRSEQKEKREETKGSVVTAVAMPAWQFFKLIPWHSKTQKEPQSDQEVATHFSSQRPVVGICLKRYEMDESGNTNRRNTYVDIPESFKLPHFIASDMNPGAEGLNTDYKLILQSVVCHRGETLSSGHYISFCRVAPKLLTDNRRYSNDPPPDYEEAQWVVFDDLCVENRIHPIDDIKEALREETPYLLFYQIVPSVDKAESSMDSSESMPPAYDTTSIPTLVSDSLQQSRPVSEASKKSSGYFDTPSTSNATGNIRFSMDIDQAPRPSFGDEGGLLDPEFASLARTPDGTSPATTPGEETTAQRMGRAAQLFRSGSRGRSQSQSLQPHGNKSLTRFSMSKRGRKERRSFSNDVGQEDRPSNTDGVTENMATSRDRKRGKSKSHADKGKGKDGRRHGDLPDRECILQ